MDVHHAKYEYVLKAMHASFTMLTLIADDGHDSSVTVAGEWARDFLTPLLSNDNFMQNTLVLLSKSNLRFWGTELTSLAFDETASYTSNNQVFSVLLGDAVPASAQGTTNGTAYNHYSQMATVENNWNLGDLGLGDASAAAFY